MSRFLLFLFFFYFKSLYHRRRDEAWLDLDGIPGRQRWRMGKGRKKGGHSRIWVGTVSVKGATRYASFSSSPPFIARGDRIPLRYLNGRHPSPLIPLPQFHARPKIFRRFRRTRILPLPLLFLPKSKAEEKFLDSP